MRTSSQWGKLHQARIAEIMRAGAERAEVTVEQVVRELSHPELSAI
jgi:hypothetical protein